MRHVVRVQGALSAASCERLRGKSYNKDILPFAECVYFMPSTGKKRMGHDQAEMARLDAKTCRDYPQYCSYVSGRPAWGCGK